MWICPSICKFPNEEVTQKVCHPQQIESNWRGTEWNGTGLQCLKLNMYCSSIVAKRFERAGNKVEWNAKWNGMKHVLFKISLAQWIVFECCFTYYDKEWNGIEHMLVGNKWNAIETLWNETCYELFFNTVGPCRWWKNLFMVEQSGIEQPISFWFIRKCLEFSCLSWAWLSICVLLMKFSIFMCQNRNGKAKISTQYSCKLFKQNGFSPSSDICSKTKYLTAQVSNRWNAFNSAQLSEWQKPHKTT